MAALSAEQLAAARAVVDAVRAGSADVLAAPELAFFRDFLDECGATLPAPKPKADADAPVAEPVELEEGCVAPDAVDDSVPLGPASTGGELSEAQQDAMIAAKGAASELAAAGDHAGAVAKYTEAICVMASALTLAKRAEAYLRMEMPNMAIRDCDAALKLNPDSAKALKVRGKAHRLLGAWEAAARDLGQGQSIDFDEDSADVQKLVEAKWHAIREARAKKEAEERDAKRAAALKEQQERLKRQQEEKEAQQAAGGGGGFPGGFPGGMPGMPPGGMPPGLDKIMQVRARECPCARERMSERGSERASALAGTRARVHL